MIATTPDLMDIERRLTAIEQRLAREDAAAAIQRGTMAKPFGDDRDDPTAFRMIEP